MTTPKWAPTQKGTGENRQDFFRGSAGGYVEILGRRLEQQIPDAASHKVSAMSVGLQSA